jgi:hypothetical protein
MLHLATLSRDRLCAFMLWSLHKPELANSPVLHVMVYQKKGGLKFESAYMYTLINAAKGKTSSTLVLIALVGRINSTNDSNSRSNDST